MAEILTFGGRRNPCESPRVNVEEIGSAMVAINQEAAPMPSGQGRSKRERELRLQAVQLVSMLPEDPAEAKRVLDYVQRIVNDFVEKERILNVIRRGD